jgi:hypothetical protein
MTTAGRSTPYLELMERLLGGTITGDEFQTQYFRVFKAEPLGMSNGIFTDDTDTAVIARRQYQNPGR